MKEAAYDVERVRREFPYFGGAHGVYLDNAATTQKPRAVIEAVTGYYGAAATVHRAIYTQGEATTVAFEEARRGIARAIGAESADEVVFTGGATAAIHLFAWGWLKPLLSGRKNRPGRVVTSALEHHSNFLPWLAVAAECGAEVVVVPVDETGGIDMEILARELGRPADLVALTLVSNVTGARLETATAAQLAHDAGAVLLVDAAQAVAHEALGLGSSGADAAVFSAHKAYGPTGCGVLWARKACLEAIVPVMRGGEMVRRVGEDSVEWNDVPRRLEAGTPDIAGVLGMAAAFGWLERTGREAIAGHEAALGRRLAEGLQAIRGLTLFSRPGPLASFIIDGVHAHDVAGELDRRGYAVRAGTLCAQPLLRQLSVPALVRASIAAYTTVAEIDGFVAAVREIAGAEKGG